MLLACPLRVELPVTDGIGAAFLVVASTHLYAGLYLKNVKIRRYLL